jgi:hypothetical protein
MPAGTNMWPFTEVYGTVSPFRSTPEIVATSCRSSMPLVCLKEFIEMSSSWSKPRALALLFLVGCGFTAHEETPGHPIDAPADSPPDGIPPTGGIPAGATAA